MALTAYQNKTAMLLQNPQAPTTLYSPADITVWVNMARGQIAGDGRCIRYIAPLPTVNNQQVYQFGAITPLGTGMANVFNVRMITAPVTGGRKMLNAWPWDYFNQNFVATTGISNAVPNDWAQYAQGINGSIFLNPIPDAVYNLQVDTVCTPIDLVNDGTAEAIPYPWTDCVPYYAAYLALLSSQTGAREGMANNMFNRYVEFRNRARDYSTADVLPYQYNQSGTLTPVPPGGVQARQ